MTQLHMTTGLIYTCTCLGKSANGVPSALLQMALWIPSPQAVYVAPAPVTTIPSTEDFITRTPYFYHANSDRLLTVGNPFYAIKDPGTQKILVPKVSGNQYRVFRIRFPDPNKFALPDPNVFNPDTERLVWGLRGIEVGRGGPLGMEVTGNLGFGRNADVENPNQAEREHGAVGTKRFNVGMEPKQNQLLIVGCSPAWGEFWDSTPACTEGDTPVDPGAGDCPALELKSTRLQDGTMTDIGFGHMNFKSLQDDKSGVPLEIVNSVCVYPDFYKMSKDPYGNSCFFSVRKEQMYIRHYFSRVGAYGDTVPTDMYLKDKTNGGANWTGPVYMGTPSGSIVSTEGQVLNRPYWLLKAQGRNNGMLWGNQCFVTVVDNTRSLNFLINVKNDAGTSFQADEFANYLRHTEEYEIACIVQLCKVRLDPETLSILNTMDPEILEEWQIGVNPPVSSQVNDRYRFVHSLATHCPDKEKAKEKEDPYAGLAFWNLDFTESLSPDLDQFPLGRRFLTQAGRAGRTSGTRSTARTGRTGTVVKRSIVSTTVAGKPRSVPAKRRRR
ncbi:L1 [Rousettus aegyptiacus papillomavirus 1]|uniref:Major capsid protein L1 n=1 Tax=Rousettus aegyptiacus papillomavirus 1 TaxID=369584 RepID=Q0QIH5_9PAPI|nr:L1 [Rousettus aegyptiacus papillomavirus 1]ABC95030.1 L1 [Rousettus aegyptiacus papillomavirus 1]